MADNEVSLNLGRFRSSFGKEYLYKAMCDACAIVRNDAITKAPRGTGELWRSIDFQVTEDGTEGIVYSNVTYAPYVEVGTGIYSATGAGRDKPWRYPIYIDGQTQYRTTRGMKPRPFLQPALTQNTSKIKDCFEGLI